jgi:hypothetical protein
MEKPIHQQYTSRDDLITDLHQDIKRLRAELTVAKNLCGVQAVTMAKWYKACSCEARQALKGE